MAKKKKILAISGSTRARSTNLNYIKAISEMGEDHFSVTLFEGLKDIPAFNPDDDTDEPPDQVKDFRSRLNNADGILICTPEYAMGVPGALKNAIDWTVSSMEFSKKPVALITASLSGLKGHAALLDILHVIEAKTSDTTAIVISYANTKITGDAKITDETTRQQLQNLVEAFSVLLNDERYNPLINKPK